MRRCVIIGVGLCTSACFSPNEPIAASDADSSDTGSSSGGTTGMTSASSSTTTVSTTSTTADSTVDSTSEASGSSSDGGPSDSPPTIENLRIDGSTESSELNLTRQVLIEVDASDDIGIDRVEFYRGADLLGTVTEAPYELLTLFTSVDNGPNWITATAYDTAEQSTQIGPVQLDVAIDGGAVLQLREQIFVSRGEFGLFSAPAVTVDMEGDVTVAGSSRYVGAGFTASRWTAVRHTDELGEIWERAYPSSMVSTSPDRLTTSAPILRGQQVLLMAVTGGAGEYAANTIHSLNVANGSVGSDTDLAFGDVYDSPPYRSLAMDGADNLLVVTTGGELQKIDPAGDLVWEADAIAGLSPNTAPSRVTVGPSDEVYVDIGCDYGQCNESNLRKFSSAGQLQWTRENASVSQPLPDGSVASVGNWFGEYITVLHRDADGVELSASELDTDPFIPLDVCATPVGDIVIGGAVISPAGLGGWAVRASAAGDVIWAKEMVVGADDWTSVSGVAVSATGRLYLTGSADVVTDEGFTGYGDAWVAELAL